MSRLNLTRSLGGLSAAGVIAGLALVGAGAAHAAPPAGSLGSITVSPAPGGTAATNGNTAITLTTGAQCADTDPNDTNLVVKVIGAGFPKSGTTVVNQSAQSLYKSGAGYQLPLADTLNNFLKRQVGANTLEGEYDFVLSCDNQSATATYGTFTGALYVTDTTTDYQLTDPANGVVTPVNTLTVSPASPGVQGTPVTLTSTLSSGSGNGNGDKVQFYNGSSPLGGKITVVGNKASYTTTAATALPYGVSSLSALLLSGTDPANNSADGTYSAGGVTNATSDAVSYTETSQSTISASPSSPQAFGTSVSFTGSVSPSTAAGSYTFTATNTATNVVTTIGTATVSGGKATVSTSTLPAGNYTVTAQFNGTTAGSNSLAAMPYTISPAAVTPPAALPDAAEPIVLVLIGLTAGAVAFAIRRRGVSI